MNRNCRVGFTLVPDLTVSHMLACIPHNYFSQSNHEGFRPEGIQTTKLANRFYLKIMPPLILCHDPPPFAGYSQFNVAERCHTN